MLTSQDFTSKAGFYHTWLALSIIPEGLLDDKLDFFRWDNSAMETLPENIVPIYKVFWNEFTEFERLFTEGSTNRVDALKQAVCFRSNS